VSSLLFVAGAIAGQRFKLGEGAQVLGRRSDCAIFVPDMRVSREHARIVPTPTGGWRLEDLGSNNGTYVNGLRVESAVDLRDGDEIQIASNKARLEEITEATAERPSRHVTIVDVVGNSLIHSHDSDGPRTTTISTGLLNLTDQRAVRLLERKVEALTEILQLTATASVDQLFDRLVALLLDLFPQAEDVGVLVEDARSGGLQVQCQRHRRATFGGSLKVPGTIIEHVVSDRRGVLLGEAAVGQEEGSGLRMGAPVAYGGESFGVIYVESARQGFRQDDVDLLQAIAVSAAMAIHASRVATQLAERQRIERDLRVARQIQRSLLPHSPPEVVGLEFAVHYEPAYQIGGDFYDFIWHDPGHLGLVVGDVSGKAISAALYMARLTSELRSRATIARTPARLLRRVNQEMAQLGDDGMFATLVYCVYDLETRSLVFTNAGHCVPLLRRGDRVFPLHADRAHTPPLGVTPDLEAGEARVQLHPGDTIIMVSDGIIEARDAAGHEYGLARLSRRFRTARGNAEDLIKSILADIDAHTKDHGQGQGDDMTIVAMTMDERRARRKTTTMPPPEHLPEAPAAVSTRAGTMDEGVTDDDPHDR
jgi:serine phosphatase RsbU (regulator of sigma subunit)/pSer/pThr/pTyr-binding forkhead associated (FHA) protein